MGRLRFLLLIPILWTSYFVRAQDYVNIDAKTAEQVMLNAAIQRGIEELHNEQVDTIKSKQQKLMELVGALAGYKELYKLTLENAKGFGEESGIYKSIVARCVSIAERSVKATEAVKKTNFTGKAITAFKIYELVTETAHLSNLFFNIVCNGTVKNPLKLEGANDDKDELNFLNRSERVTMALKIKDELKRIDRTLLMVEWYCKNNSVENLLKHIDRETWITYVYSQVSAKSLIRQWNALNR